MNNFTNNSSYKVIRITDDNSIPLTFDTYYNFEKRNFDIINIPDDSQVNDILLNHPDVSAIVIQFKGDRPNMSNLQKLPDYYKSRIFEYDTEYNHGIDLALSMTNMELTNSLNPNFSFVTPLYNTKLEYFKKTYLSLCSQTVNDWEWVLIDDSPEPLEYIKDFINERKDVRIKYFRIAPTGGNIGLSKWRGNCMAKGKWLIELDHDDIIMSWCLETIINAINKFPDNKFIYSDNTTIDENDNITPCRYGEDYTWGLGYGHSYLSNTPYEGKTIRTDSSGPINNACIRHIVGVPNHFRCWERDFYFSIGGHNQQTRIADDYELLVRSFLKTRFTHIQACCYAQRFDGNNSQYKENVDTDGQGNIDDIQRRVRLTSIHYDQAIHDRLIELGMNDDNWIEGDPYMTLKVYEKLHVMEVCEDQFDPFNNFIDTDKPIKLGIFFLATSVYKEYFKEFANSLKNLFPNVGVEKHLIIMSDGLKEYDGKNLFGCKCHHFDVIDYPYPLVPMNKFQMVSKYLHDLNLDYGMFFDSDTIIFEKSHKFWVELKRKLMSNKLMCSSHPHYLYNPNMDMSEPLVVSNPKSVAYMSESDVNDNRSYIITSFFAGSREVITKYANKIYSMIGCDLANIRWIPQYVDEAYMNKIYIVDVIKGHETDIIKEKYNTMNPYPMGMDNYPERDNGDIYTNNFPEYDDTIFMNQKFNTALKNRKKYNQV